MNEFTAIMKKISASGIKSADFRIRIAEKTHDPPPYRLSEEWMTPLYAFIKTVTPPLYSATPHPPPSAEIYEQSLGTTSDHDR